MKSIKLLGIIFVLVFLFSCERKTSKETISIEKNVTEEIILKQADYTEDSMNLHPIDYDPIQILSFIESTTYFTVEFVRNALEGVNIPIYNMIFDRTKSDGLRIYAVGAILHNADGEFDFYSDTFFNYIEYENYNIILVTQRIDGIHFVRDYLIIEKQNPETYLISSADTVQIDGFFPRFNVTIVVNNHRRNLLYGEDLDVSQAFTINMKTRKIEEIFFDTISLASEI